MQPLSTGQRDRLPPHPPTRFRIHFSSRAAGEEGELLGIQTPRLG